MSGELVIDGSNFQLNVDRILNQLNSFDILNYFHKTIF